MVVSLYKKKCVKFITIYYILFYVSLQLIDMIKLKFEIIKNIQKSI